MKKELLKGLTMFVLVTVFALATAVLSANAQSANRVVATIPFEFSVGYKPMPAGEYSVQPVTAGSSGLMIRSADGKRAAIRLTDETGRAKKNNTQARLVFHRYGERYFLAEVWNGFDNTGRHLLKSKEESAIERELASIPSTNDSAKNTYETVEILAVLR
jgi:hypothetical protein